MKKRLRIILIIIAALSVASAIFVSRYRNSKSARPPVIEFENSVISVSVKASDEELLQGVTATDPEDGDVTKSLVVEGVSDIKEGNQIEVTYAAFDSKNHVAKAKRTVRFTDYDAPHFTMSGPLIFQRSKELNILSVVGAADSFDGDISRAVKYSVSEGMTLSEPGEYRAELKVSNKIGDTATLPVTIVITSEKPNPADIKLKNYIVYVKQGDGFDEKSYVESYKNGGELRDSAEGLSIDSNVDTQNAGVYVVNYSYTDNKTVSTTRLVVVVK